MFRTKLVLILTWLFFQGYAWTQPPEDRPLIEASHISYLGSFKVPGSDAVGCNSGTGEHCFAYGGVFGYNPSNNTLLMKGHSWAGGVGEVSIPETLDGSATAEVLQNISDIADGAIVDPGETNGQGPSAMLAYNGRWIISGSTYYDADYTQVNTHGVSGADLSVSSDFQGWFPFEEGLAANPRSIGGYMTTIPQEWQETMGGPALTGHCCLSIISASSSGPSVTVFDPDDVGVQTPIPGTTLLFYPTGNPLAPNSTQNDLFNLATKMAGIAFPAGSASVLFFGHQGTGPYCYGEGSECNDPCDGSKGTHAAPYRHQVWAYDANELLQVKEGDKESWEVQPYAVWPLEDMNNGNCAKLSGTAYDAASGKMYVTENFSENPKVHVYQIALSNTSINKKNAPITDVSNLSVKASPMGGGIRFDIHSESITHHLNSQVLDLQGKSLTKLILTAESPTHFTSYWNGVDGKNGASGGSFILSIHSGDRQVYLKLFQIGM